MAANARLTAANAAVLLVLLAAEGVTILRVRALLTPHVFIGVVLIPPVLLKMASTSWRFCSDIDRHLPLVTDTSRANAPEAPTSAPSRS